MHLRLEHPHVVVQCLVGVRRYEGISDCCFGFSFPIKVQIWIPTALKLKEDSSFLPVAAE